MTAPPEPVVHVLLGTMAEYLKTAPLLRLLADDGVPFRLVDLGQHGAYNAEMRDRLGLPDPDVELGDGRDKETVGQVVRWAFRQSRRLGSPRRLRSEVFAGRPGVAVVHGDTPSTLMGTLMARRAGLPVAHLEAGLRSRDLLHPFPEELTRVVVMRLAHVLFAPGAEAVSNLQAMRIGGTVVPLPGNTGLEALVHDLQQPDDDGLVVDAATLADLRERADGAVVVTCHRVENLTNRQRVQYFHDVLVDLARRYRVVFAMHGPTRAVFGERGLDRSLADAGVELTELLPHREFTTMLARAPFVITDGGSIQEECALLGTPTLLWRRGSERPDGVGRNVVVSGYDREVVADFLADPTRHGRRPGDLSAVPSQVVFEHLRDMVRT